VWNLNIAICKLMLHQQHTERRQAAKKIGPTNGKRAPFIMEVR
jgi:hypothetical protein